MQRTSPITESGTSAALEQLEGIALLPSGLLALVREEPSETLLVDPETGDIKSRRSLKSVDHDNSAWPLFEDDDDDGNKGLEGIAYAPDTDEILALKELHPRLLLSLSADLTAVVSVTALSKEMGFDAPSVKDKNTDVSGIAVDRKRNLLWILSDKGKVVFAFDRITDRAQAIPLTWDGEPVKGAEGIAINQAGDTIFIVTDDEPKSRFLKFAIRDE